MADLFGGFKAVQNSGTTSGTRIGRLKQGQTDATLTLNGKNETLPKAPINGEVYKVREQDGNYSVRLQDTGKAAPDVYQLQRNTLFGFDQGLSWEKK